MTDRLDALRKLHDADPRDAELPYMIAMEHSKAGRHEDAVEWFDKALALSASMHYAYFQKAKSLSALSRDTEARQTLTLGLTRATSDGNQKAAGEIADLLDSMAG